MKRFIYLFIVIGIGISVLYSCSNEFRGFDKTETGVYYKFFKKNDGPKLKPGDEFTFFLEYTIGDSIIFSSRTNPYANKQLVLESECKGDIYECLQLMSVGDSARFILEADSFYLVTARFPQLPKGIKPNSKLYAEVSIKSVKPKEELDIEKRRKLAENKKEEAKLFEFLMSESGITKELEGGNGILYKTLKNGSGNKALKGDYIFLEYYIHNSKNKEIFKSTKHRDRLVFQCMGKNFEGKGFNYAISQMKKGEESVFLVPSELAFGEEGIKGQIAPYEPLLYTVLIHDIMPKDEYEQKLKDKNQELIDAENKKIAEFIKKNNITQAPRESGLIFIEKSSGQGEYAKEGNLVEVHYTLYDLDGKKIDSSLDRGKPYSFVIGKKNVIEAWDEALTLMKEGGSATIIAPSKIAYKNKKRSNDILPYTPLLFELELISIK